jgi:hypothetical protein
MTHFHVYHNITGHLVFVLVSTEWVMMSRETNNSANSEICSVICFLHAKYMSTEKIYREFWAVYGQIVMSEEPVAQWRRLFKDGWINVHDEEWISQPAICSEWWSCSNCWPNNLQKAALHNCRTLYEFAQISPTVVCEIITVRLGYHKFCARCVPKMLTVAHKTQRMASALTFLERYHKDGD